MVIRNTPVSGLLIIEPKVFVDQRGYFFESYNQEKYETAGIRNVFVQDNQSKSKYGVIRGLHYQKNPHSQAKLIRVLEGVIWDVALDIRQGSPTFGKWFGIELSAENHIQFYIPSGFAHGFSVLSASTVVLYKSDDFYHPESEAGINCLDPSLEIDWKIPSGKQILSEKDQRNPYLAEADLNFSYNP